MRLVSLVHIATKNEKLSFCPATVHTYIYVRVHTAVTRTRYRGFDFPNIIESHRSLSFLGYTPPLTEANLTHLTEGAFRGLGLSGHELEAARISQIPRCILQYADTRHAAGNGEPQRARLAYW